MLTAEVFVAQIEMWKPDLDILRNVFAVLDFHKSFKCQYNTNASQLCQYDWRGDRRRSWRWVPSCPLARLRCAYTWVADGVCLHTIGSRFLIRLASRAILRSSGCTWCEPLHPPLVPSLCRSPCSAVAESKNFSFFWAFFRKPGRARETKRGLSESWCLDINQNL